MLSNSCFRYHDMWHCNPWSFKNSEEKIGEKINGKLSIVFFLYGQYLF